MSDKVKIIIAASCFSRRPRRPRGLLCNVKVVRSACVVGIQVEMLGVQLLYWKHYQY